ncbi:MAG: PHP domain-containing protein, partial [Pseudomonadota bacterium]
MAVELAATTNFTFLTGASHPEEMVERAAELGLDAIAIADRMSLAGVVRAHVRLKEIAREEVSKKAPNITGKDVVAHARRIRALTRVDPSSRMEEPLPDSLPAELAEAPESYRSIPRLIVGARLAFTDSAVEVIALAPDRPAYAALSRLLTLGKRRAPKGDCHLSLADLEDESAPWHGRLIGLIALPDPLSQRRADEPSDGTNAAAGRPRARPPAAGAGTVLADATRLARRLARAAVLAAPRYDGRDAQRFDALAGRARRLGLPLAATAEPMMHRGARRRLADVLTCIRERLTVDTLGTRALPNAERHLRSPEELDRLFARHHTALAEAD